MDNLNSLLTGARTAISPGGRREFRRRVTNTQRGVLAGAAGALVPGAGSVLLNRWVANDNQQQAQPQPDRVELQTRELNRYGGLVRENRELHRREALPEDQQALYNGLADYQDQLEELGPNRSLQDVEELRQSLSPEFLEQLTVLEQARDRDLIAQRNNVGIADPQRRHQATLSELEEYRDSLPESDRTLIRETLRENSQRPEGLYPFNQRPTGVPTRKSHSLGFHRLQNQQNTFTASSNLSERGIV